MKFVIFVILICFYLPVFSADVTDIQIQARPRAETKTEAETSSNGADISKTPIRIVLPAPLAPKDTGIGVESY